jgi:hypothetical protein
VDKRGTEVKYEGISARKIIMNIKRAVKEYNRIIFRVFLMTKITVRPPTSVEI